MRLCCARMIKIAVSATVVVFMTFAPLCLVLAGPASTAYELKQYSFGASSTENAASTNYSALAVAGEPESGKPESTNYKTEGGLVYTINANLPPAPTFTNPNNYYNKLKLVINKGDNASDTTYAVAISTDNFATDTKYVQSDLTVGPSLGSEDWMTYTAWGGLSGVNIIGLSQNTTYTIKVSAKKGGYTQTGFGPTASATTVNPMIAFDIDVSATDSDTEPPFDMQFSDLLAGSIVDSPKKVWVDLATNGGSGGKVYVYGQNGGLLSSTASYTITSVTNDLSAVSEGFGAQGTSATQTSGGPLSINSPYNGSENNIGVANANIREIFSSGSPITGGRGSFLLKAKSSSVTPASDDYGETLTLIASASF